MMWNSRCGWRPRWRRGGSAGPAAGQYSLLREVAGRAEPGSDGWCAAQFWLGRAAAVSADLAGALGHSTAVRDAAADRGPCRELADGLASRSGTLTATGPVRRGGR